MIFEIIEKCNETDSVVVIIDNHTFNQIMKMIICEAYHKGQKENADMDANGSENDSQKDNS